MANHRYILAVCTGNTCRSPMAEGLLKHALKAEAEPLRSIQVISAGVAAYPGAPISTNSSSALKKVGINLSAHKSRPLTDALVRDALAIFCMTDSHRQAILEGFSPAPANLHLFREFLPPDAERQIADPIGGPLADYEACRDEMVEAIPSLITYLKKLTGGPA